MRGAPLADPALNTMRLRLNRLLNLSGKGGRTAGHTLGVLGLFFSSAESIIGYASDQALPDSANSVLAGVLLCLFDLMCLPAACSMPVRPCTVFENIDSVDSAQAAVSHLVHTGSKIVPDTGFGTLVLHRAGALSGALFRAPRGPRTALVAGAIGAVAASALVLARQNLSKSL